MIRYFNFKASEEFSENEDEDEEEETSAGKENNHDLHETAEESKAGLTFNCTENMSSTMAPTSACADKSSRDLSKNKKKKSTLSKSKLLESAKKNSKSIGPTLNHISSSKNDVTQIKEKNKKLNKTVGFANITKDTTDIESKSNEELKKENLDLRCKLEQSKNEWIKCESDLRRELVNKWSKRIEELEENHQEEIKKQRIQVEDHWYRKMNVLEELCEVKSQNRLNENQKEWLYQSEMFSKRIGELELELQKSYEELATAKATLKTATDKKLFQIKSERMSQSAFETHLRLDEKDEHDENETTNNQTSAFTNLTSNRANESNKRKLDHDSCDEEEDDITNNMEFEDEFSTQGDNNLENISKSSLGNKNKRRNTLMNHSMQTDFVKGGNISVQTDTVQRCSVGLEANMFFLDSF